MKRLFSFLLIGCIAVLAVSCSAEFSKVLKSKDNEYKLTKANEYYQAGAQLIQSGKISQANKKLNQAHQLYDELLKTFLKGTPRYEENFYKFAMTSYLLRDYVEAEMTFNAYMDNFPTGSRIEEAYFLRGKSLAEASPRAALDQGSTLKAISLLQAYLATFPTGANAKEAAEILAGLQAKLEEKQYMAAQLYFDREQYLAAQVTFNSLIEKFPESKNLEDYSYKEVLSSYRYAKNSLLGLQTERFNKAIEDVQFFKSGFPETKYKKEITDIETDINKELAYLKTLVNNT